MNTLETWSDLCNHLRLGAHWCRVQTKCNAICGHPELHDNSKSNFTEKRTNKELPWREGIENIRLLCNFFFKYVSVQHSIDLIDRNSIQGISIWRLVCLSSGQQSWQSINSGFLQDRIMMFLILTSFLSIYCSEITEKSLHVGSYWCCWLFLFTLLARIDVIENV